MLQVPVHGTFQHAQGVDASHSVFNDVGRDQFNVNFNPGRILDLSQCLSTDTFLDSVSAGIVST